MPGCSPRPGSRRCMAAAGPGRPAGGCGQGPPGRRHAPDRAAASGRGADGSWQQPPPTRVDSSHGAQPSPAGRLPPGTKDPRSPGEPSPTLRDRDDRNLRRALAGRGRTRETSRVASIVRASVRVEGVVQGVGFRPFVYSLATRLGLAGWVGNDVDGVFAEVEGVAACVEQFLGLLEAQAPPLARVDRVTAAAMAPTGAAGFAIVASDRTGRRRALVSADSATCDDCLAELRGPGGPAVRLPVHQLHQLRAPVHHRHRRALRPAADHHGAVRHVRGMRGGVPRSGGPQVPRRSRSAARPAGRGCACSTPAAQRDGGEPAWPKRPRLLGRARSWRSRGWGDTTSPWTRAARPPRRRCGRASTGRTSRSP